MRIIAQSHLNGTIYPAEISLFGLLMDPFQEILGLSRLEELAAFWQCQCIKWHLERGLRLTRAENPCLRHR